MGCYYSGAIVRSPCTFGASDMQTQHLQPLGFRGSQMGNIVESGPRVPPPLTPYRPPATVLLTHSIAQWHGPITSVYSAISHKPTSGKYLTRFMKVVEVLDT